MGLSEVTKLSRTTLWRRFTPFFNYRISPEVINKLFPLKHCQNNCERWVLGLDGKWLHRFGVIMIYRDITNGINLWWSWQKSESYQHLCDDFYYVYLLTKLNPPSGIVSDWKSSIVALGKDFYPGIAHQRCLAHMVREARRLLPARSPFTFTLKLREIALNIMDISDPTDYFYWEQELGNWRQSYDQILRLKSFNPEVKKTSWFTHQNLRRAINLLTKDQESLFKYLHYNFLPKTNNSLEGVNSQLKQKLGDHRGMKPEQQIAFCYWHLTFSRVKTKKDLKKLWDSLKKEISVV